MKPSGLIRIGWCQRSYAKDIYGAVVDADDPRACRWCLFGALIACYGRGTLRWRNVYGRLIAKTGFERSSELVSWNDDPERSQQAVVDLLESVGE